MWLFCELGFFSIVHKNCEADQVLVRARCQGDLEALKQRCPTMGAILATPSGDYAFRATVDREDLARALGEVLMGLDYSNFKARIESRTHDAERMSAYHGVWAVMARWQSAIASRLRRRSNR